MIEIDGVRNALESPIWESGDYISDKYWELLDLATSPKRASEFDKKRMGHIVRGLNRNLGTTALLFDTSVEWGDDSLHAAYNNVVEQINGMTASVEEVPQLEPITVAAIMERPVGSATYIHGGN